MNRRDSCAIERVRRFGRGRAVVSATRIRVPALIVVCLGLGALPGIDAAESAPAAKELHLVIDAESPGLPPAPVLEAGKALVGGREERILAPGKDYRRQFGMPLGVSRYPSGEAFEKARWLRDWLSRAVAPGGTIVFLGDETVLPAWQVRLGELTLTTDALYSDLDDDGIPETSVSRIVGPPEVMKRKIASIEGRSGTFGLVAITLEK